MNVYQHNNSKTIHLVKGCAHNDSNNCNEFKLCMHCSKTLNQQKRIYRTQCSGYDTEFHAYDGKQGKSRLIEQPPHVKIRHNDLIFTESAKSLVDKKLQYMRAYISENKKMLALEPVSGGDVTGDCLSIKSGKISFWGLKNELDIEFESSGVELFEISWDEDDGWFVIDFSAKSI